LDQTPEESAATLQAKLLSLSSLHQQATVELATKESEIAKLHTRLTDTSNSSQSLISELTKKMTEIERELRWAKQGREAAEKSEARAKKELDSYYQYQDTGVGLDLDLISIFIIHSMTDWS
jgi:mitotic spindle assembly checkpoint protein MAD1